MSACAGPYSNPGITGATTGPYSRTDAARCGSCSQHEEIARLLAGLASLRRELSESLTAQARLAGAVSPPELPNADTRPSIADRARAMGIKPRPLEDIEVELGGPPPPLYRRTRPSRPGLLVDPADDLAELDARIAATPADYPGLPYMRRCRDALAALRSVPSETAQTEENETRG